MAELKPYKVYFLSLTMLLFACSSIRIKLTNGVLLKVDQYQVPVLRGSEQNPVLHLTLIPVEDNIPILKEIEINMEGQYGLRNIKSVRMHIVDSKNNTTLSEQFGVELNPENKLVFKDHRVIEDTIQLVLSIQLKDTADLLNSYRVSCEKILTTEGMAEPDSSFSPLTLREGLGLRNHMDDNVHTYQIPSITTTSTGTLLAIYDIRHDSARDLQGNVDIGLSRSTDGGNTWEPMQKVLDMGEWGGLPEKFNGVSDACILVDKNTNTIYVAGLWMHGVINSNGDWVEGLTQSSSDWNHQWRNKGSQSGFGVKETSQFLLTKSTDDGQTWSEPINLTRQCKKEEWWLWAPAPGHGITLTNGTLVFPTQGRDRNGRSFSNITWSNDGGDTWNTSNVASHGTTENMVVQLTDGSLMLNARDGKNKGNTSDQNGRVISITRDLGETWTEHGTSRGALVEPACMASLHKHEYHNDGQKKSILLFSNPNSKTSRNRMTIKVSFDDGKTWPEEYWLLLDEKRGRGYSCITSIDEQTIGILYEGSRADMTFQKIRLSEILKK